MGLRVTVRLYAELNDFVPRSRRGRDLRLELKAATTVKDLVEGLGVPHTEVGGAWRDGIPAGPGELVRDGDRLTVTPGWRSLPVPDDCSWQADPPNPARFVLDVHLGRLAQLLRLLGFDCLYRNDADDDALAATAAAGQRILLTRDIGLLKRSVVRHGAWLRATDPVAQAIEVLRRLGLHGALRPFTRCMACNGTLEAVDRGAVAERVPVRVVERHEAFHQCPDCGRVYWAGSHHAQLADLVARITAGNGAAAA